MREPPVKETGSKRGSWSSHGVVPSIAVLVLALPNFGMPLARRRRKDCTIAPMPNIASILKEEISRVARKEVRAETQGLKKAVTSYRTEIAALKRRAQALEQEVRRLSKSTAKAAPSARPAEPAGPMRFSAKGLASQRQRLALSADDCGLLLGVSGQSVYNWESGKARPRESVMPAIAALRSLGKKDAETRLAALHSAK
jgi:DNA-binding transcriptional regulator YiaG